MDGITFSWLSTILVGVAVLVVLLISLVLAWRLGRITTTTFYCSWAQRNVVVQCLTCDGEHPIGVITCTAFADPRAITCGTPCVGGEQRRGADAGDRRVAEELLSG